jgi:hypothetical protein
MHTAQQNILNPIFLTQKYSVKKNQLAIIIEQAESQLLSPEIL